MNQKVSSFFAGIGILALVFFAYANTTTANLASNPNPFEIGKKYHLQLAGSGHFRIKVEVIAKTGDWIKVHNERSPDFNYINTLTIQQARKIE